MNFLKQWRLALGIVLCAVIAVVANAYPGKSSSTLESNAGPQDLGSLDRRISSLERQLYSFQASINRLEQAALMQRSPVSQPSANAQEIYQLRSEMQVLQLRLREIECGLIKLDERTISAAARDTRESAPRKLTDPCRLNAATPLRLSTRP